MDTMGSLCDKLTIIKLKQWHTTDGNKLQSLAKQECQLKEEIDSYVNDAIDLKIPSDRLTYSSNKVYKLEGNQFNKISGEIGILFSQLATVNCALWHEQEKVYEFEKVPSDERPIIVNKLATLNLERNYCIDEIDRKFSEKVLKKSR